MLPRAAGAEVDDGVRCQPNVRVYFETQPQKQLDEVIEHAPTLLGAYYPAQAKQFETVSRVIQAWYVTATRCASGEQTVDSIWKPTPGGKPGSRLSAGVSSWIVHVLVIVDSKRVAGYTIGSISHYIAMLVLAQGSSLDTCDELPSITQRLRIGGAAI